MCLPHSYGRLGGDPKSQAHDVRLACQVSNAFPRRIKYSAMLSASLWYLVSLVKAAILWPDERDNDRQLSKLLEPCLSWWSWSWPITSWTALGWTFYQRFEPSDQRFSNRWFSAADDWPFWGSWDFRRVVETQKKKSSFVKSKVHNRRVSLNILKFLFWHL